MLKRSKLFHFALTGLYAALALFSAAALIGNLCQNWLPGLHAGLIAVDILTAAGVARVIFSAVILIRECGLSFRLVQDFEVDGKQ